MSTMIRILGRGLADVCHDEKKKKDRDIVHFKLVPCTRSYSLHFLRACAHHLFTASPNTNSHPFQFIPSKFISSLIPTQFIPTQLLPHFNPTHLPFTHTRKTFLSLCHFTTHVHGSNDRDCTELDGSSRSVSNRYRPLRPGLLLAWRARAHQMIPEYLPKVDRVPCI